jgi:hypothetical protein
MSVTAKKKSKTKSRPAKEGDIVFVRWDDSSGYNRWTEKDAAWRTAADDALACESVGWLLRRTRSSLTIYQSITRDQHKPDVDHQLQIPAGCVRRVRVLRRGR